MPVESKKKGGRRQWHIIEAPNKTNPPSQDKTFVEERNGRGRANRYNKARRKEGREGGG